MAQLTSLRHLKIRCQQKPAQKEGIRRVEKMPGQQKDPLTLQGKVRLISANAGQFFYLARYPLSFNLQK